MDNERGGVEVLTGSGHSGSGSMDLPEGTSTAIIDELFTPGSGAPLKGRGVLKEPIHWLKFAIGSFQMALLGSGELNKLERYQPESEYGWMNHINPHGLDTSTWSPPGWGGGHQQKLPRVIYNNGEPVDTIPAEWDVPDKPCIGCYRPEHMKLKNFNQ